MGIARDFNDLLYVAGGGSNNVVKFDTTGNYLGQFSHPDLTGAQGVAFDDRGHLYSTSFYQDLIVEFDSDLNYVRTISVGALSVPRSVAFHQLPYCDIDDNGEVNLDDLQCLLDGLSGQPSCAGVSTPELDVHPCGVGNGDLNLYDLVSLLDAIAGFPGCP